MKASKFLIPIVVVAVVGVLSSVFIVDEREKALVLQFGQIKSVKEDPGLAFKIPLIQEVVTYDDRILSRDTDPLEVTPLDDRRLVVDAFARYRIVDPLQMYISARTEERVSEALRPILASSLRNELGRELGLLSEAEEDKWAPCWVVL